MKNHLIINLILLLAVLGVKAQTTCSSYYPFEEGTTFQITLYDEKEKLVGVLDYLVKEASDNNAIFAYEMHDEKGKMITASEYGITCTGDGVSIDFKSLAAPGITEQYKDMEMEMTGTDLILPNNLSVGQTLPDSEMLMTVRMAPINMNMNTNVFNRKVEARESLTTPAGTFDCYVITFDTEAKMGFKVSSSGKQWIAQGVGMVKQESYNKKGKLTGVSLLTAFNK